MKRLHFVAGSLHLLIAFLKAVLKATKFPVC